MTENLTGRAGITLSKTKIVIDKSLKLREAIKLYYILQGQAIS